MESIDLTKCRVNGAKRHTLAILVFIQLCPNMFFVNSRNVFAMLLFHEFISLINQRKIVFQDLIVNRSKLKSKGKNTNEKANFN